jgi:imidazolonepropionase
MPLPMIDLVVLNATELVTARTDSRGAVGPALHKLDVLRDGALAIDKSRIVDVGSSRSLGRKYRARRTLDARGKLVTPGLVDCHSHLVFAGSRHVEYEQLVTGETAPGKKLEGGIRYTVARTRAASTAALTTQALRDLDLMLQHGTTTVEIKTGYGLDRDTELRMLRVIHGLRKHAVDVVPTYLGAHVLPAEFAERREDYVKLVIDTLPAAKRWAEYCDVWCDTIAFTAAETERICQAATALGFRLRLHADQVGDAHGAELAARLGASSADHLDNISDDGIAALARSGTVGVLLPSVTLHMMETTTKAFWPELARRMMDAGMRLALSADYNPGTSPTPSMQTVMQLAARLYRLGYSEIWHMATINAAHALDRGADRGSLERGKRADVVIWQVPEHGMVINRFGVNLVDTVVKDGRVAWTVRR